MEQTKNRGPVVWTPRTRRTFLKGAGAAGLMALIASGGSGAQAASFAKSVAVHEEWDDLDILNFALTLEHLEARFYKDAVGGGNLTDRSSTILTAVRDHEVAHVEALSAALEAADYEGMAEEQDEYNFGDMDSEDAILATAEVLEGVGVGAYTGAAALLTSKEILAVAGSIEQVESRHHAAIRLLNGKSASTGALGGVLGVHEVLEAVTPILGGS